MHDTRTLKLALLIGMQPSLPLLNTPVIFLLWRVKRPAVQKVYSFVKKNKNDPSFMQHIKHILFVWSLCVVWFAYISLHVCVNVIVASGHLWSYSSQRVQSHYCESCPSLSGHSSSSLSWITYRISVLLEKTCSLIYGMLNSISHWRKITFLIRLLGAKCSENTFLTF